MPRLARSRKKTPGDIGEWFADTPVPGHILRIHIAEHAQDPAIANRRSREGIDMQQCVVFGKAGGAAFDSDRPKTGAAPFQCARITRQ